MICTTCHQEKPLDDFHADGRTKSGFSSVCEECFEVHRLARNRGYKRADRSKAPEKVRATYRDWYLRKKYGITSDQFDEMFERQGRRCAGCSSPEPGWNKGWHLDHDHGCCPGTPTCGSCNRGVLCQRCNLLLGQAQDNPDVLLALVEYLKGRHYKAPDIESVFLNGVSS